MDGFNNNYRRVHRITIVNKTLILSDKDKQELAKYAESEKPYESCAILIGNEAVSYTHLTLPTNREV